MDLLARPDRPLSPRVRRALKESEYYDDLVLLRDLDEAGRLPGVPVGTIDAALATSAAWRPRSTSDRSRQARGTRGSVSRHGRGIDAIPRPPRRRPPTRSDDDGRGADAVLRHRGRDPDQRLGHRRASAGAAAFGLDYPEFQTRHEMLKTSFETGRLSLEGYIRKTVFHRSRPFSPEDFQEFMYGQSQPLDGALDWIRALAAAGKHRMFTLNNESRELHEHRVRTFRLHAIFHSFFTSCYLGQVKPDEAIYLNALGSPGAAGGRRSSSTTAP
jgi:hypothetical protein